MGESHQKRSHREEVVTSLLFPLLFLFLPKKRGFNLLSVSCLHFEDCLSALNMVEDLSGDGGGDGSGDHHLDLLNIINIIIIIQLEYFVSFLLPHSCVSALFSSFSSCFSAVINIRPFTVRLVLSMPACLPLCLSALICQSKLHHYHRHHHFTFLLT